MHPEGLIKGLAIGAGVVVIAWYATRRWRFGPAIAPRPPSRDYLAGLNFLVNEQPDRAVEAFLRAVALDRDTVETHFALGALFRRRGEVDRAIRLHQNLIARTDLDREFREQASYALAQDYLRAGLLDRAEKLLEGLSESGPYRIAALRDLVRVYEIQHEWERAIAVQRELVRVAHAPQPQAAAHYHCELAELARARGDFAAARSHLRAARGEQRRFPRSALVRANVALDMGEPDVAERLLRAIILEYPLLAGQALPQLTVALAAQGRGQELGPMLAELASEGSEVATQLAHAVVLGDELDTPQARDIARRYVLADPGIAELVTALLPPGGGLDDAGLKRLCAALRHQAERTPRRRCADCGFTSSTFFWQCPGCKAWDSLRPLAPHEVESPPPARKR
jgi:lipopolysaccharide biosynthesis regulator YciM